MATKKHPTLTPEQRRADYIAAAKAVRDEQAAKLAAVQAAYDAQQALAAAYADYTPPKGWVKTGVALNEAGEPCAYINKISKPGHTPRVTDLVVL